MSPAEFYEKNQRQECTPLKEIKLLLFFSHLTLNNHYSQIREWSQGRALARALAFTLDGTNEFG